MLSGTERPGCASRYGEIREDYLASQTDQRLVSLEVARSRRFNLDLTVSPTKPSFIGTSRLVGLLRSRTSMSLTVPQGLSSPS